jgi:hypothetical protein
MAKYEIGNVVDVIKNVKDPDLIGIACVLEVRENEPQDEGGIRNVYRVRVRDRECWMREEHLSIPPMTCSFCGGPVPCTRAD